MFISFQGLVCNGDPSAIAKLKKLGTPKKRFEKADWLKKHFEHEIVADIAAK